MPAVASTEQVGVSPASACGLDRYLRLVAAALALPAGGLHWEIAEQAHGYLALDQRHPAYPRRDVMLVWQETAGWSVETEPTSPGDDSIVIAHLRGDVLPSPEVVAAFVTDVLSGKDRDGAASRMAPISPCSRESVAGRLAAYHHVDVRGP